MLCVLDPFGGPWRHFPISSTAVLITSLCIHWPSSHAPIGKHTTMHYLHPRSRQTGTLFTATLAVSFLVVALPHMLPCPVDRRGYADTIEMPDGTIKRRRRRQKPVEEDESKKEEVLTTVDASRPPRECPVPKPSGLVGQMMGFEKKEPERPSDVVVQALERRRAREDGSQGDTP